MFLTIINQKICITPESIEGEVSLSQSDLEKYLSEMYARKEFENIAKSECLNHTRQNTYEVTVSQTVAKTFIVNGDNEEDVSEEFSGMVFEFTEGDYMGDTFEVDVSEIELSEADREAAANQAKFRSKFVNLMNSDGENVSDFDCVWTLSELMNTFIHKTPFLEAVERILAQKSLCELDYPREITSYGRILDEIEDLSQAHGYSPFDA